VYEYVYRWKHPQNAILSQSDSIELLIVAYPPELVPLTMLGFPCKGIWNYRRNDEEATIQ